MSNKKWCYSKNGENFYGEFDTKEEAIEEAIEEAKEDYGDDCTEIYIGNPVLFVPEVNACSVIDNLIENACEHGGEYADSYLTNISKEEINDLEKRLTETFNQWAKETKNEPTFYGVENIELVKI